MDQLIRCLFSAAICGLLAVAGAGAAVAQVLAGSASVSGDSITRAFDANTDLCTYSDNLTRDWATGDDHGMAFCAAGPDGTFSHAERLECSAGANIARFNDAASGADMGDFHGQAQRIRANLTAAPGPRYVPVLLGHNDACTDTLSKTGNDCRGDFDPNNYCRRTPAAFEREFRRGMDELIQIPSARILVLALIRISQLCNFSGHSACGILFGLECNVLWGTSGLLQDVFGTGGICSSLTSDCSNRRRIDMYETLVAYNEVLERVSAEYTVLAPGAASTTGAVKAADVAVRYTDATFYYLLRPADVSCCDCYHPSDLGQQRLAELIWNGLPCSAGIPCCGPSDDPLANARCDVVDTSSEYAGGFWANGVRCGGDCSDDGVVTVDELVVGVNIALGIAGLDTCPAFEVNPGGSVSGDAILVAVEHALSGCR